MKLSRRMTAIALLFASLSSLSCITSKPVILPSDEVIVINEAGRVEMSKGMFKKITDSNGVKLVDCNCTQ